MGKSKELLESNICNNHCSDVANMKTRQIWFKGLFIAMYGGQSSMDGLPLAGSAKLKDRKKKEYIAKPSRVIKIDSLGTYRCSN